MTRPTILDSENVALLDLTPSGRAKPAWAAAAEKVVAQQMASLTASVMRRAGDDYSTAWDDVRKYVGGLERERDDADACLREVIRHARNEGNSYREDEFGAPYVVNTRAEAAEARIAELEKDNHAALTMIAMIEKRLADAERVISKQRAALQPLSDAVFNDNGDITVNLSMPTGEEFIAAYFAIRAARAYTEGK